MVHFNIIGEGDKQVEFSYSPKEDMVNITISDLPGQIGMSTEVYREDFLQLILLLAKNIELTKQEKK